MIYTFRLRNIRGKAQAKIMGKCLEERALNREKRYIQTQYDTRKGAFKDNGNVFIETRVKKRRFLHSDTE
jgi:hypothetical protein